VLHLLLPQPVSPGRRARRRRGVGDEERAVERLARIATFKKLASRWMPSTMKPAVSRSSASWSQM
jgi:hypothetical protein